MNKEDIKIGKKVWYYPIFGGTERKEATITSGPYEMCGTICCFINICSSVVDIENLEDFPNMAKKLGEFIKIEE